MVVIIDTHTGKTAVSDTGSYFWWSDGNGSCDCNRALAFGKLVEEDQIKKLGISPGTCLGEKRFLIYDTDIVETGMTNDAVLASFNSNYPDDLVEHFVVLPKAANRP